MPANPPASFADALRQARLLETAQLDALMRELQPRFTDARALAGELIRREWLTPFQANQLLQGRGHQLLLGSYVLLERLGEGGMGAVFKARNWKLGQTVALKLVRRDRLDNADAVRRFHREIRAAAQLDHPNIVRAIDADEVGGVHLLVMEYVRGVDLARLVKQRGPLAVDKACDYCRQAALGLQHAAERGMVHRDIKPQNLLLTAEGAVKILDMGLARLSQAGEHSGTMTREGIVMGTLDYIAPEQAMDSHAVDVRADLYSLGCTLYHLLTGKVPFPGGSAMEKLLKHRLDEPTPPEQLRPGVPRGASAVVRRLMAKRPQDRFQTAAEAALALAAAPAIRGPEPAESATAVAPRPPDDAAAEGTAAGWSSLDTPASGTINTVPAPRRRRKGAGLSPWIVLGAVVSAAVLALALWLFFQMLPRDPAPAPTARPAPAPHKDTAEEEFEKWARSVAALPAEKQGDAVGAELKRRNPGFDGKATATVEGGAVVGLHFLTDNVKDISPVRALPKLKTLDCSATPQQKGRLSDLSPLKGMSLTRLVFTDTLVSDLAPLQGMPLTHLEFHRSSLVSDLSPLKGAPLTAIYCDGVGVADLSPLRDMKLTALSVGAAPVSDLSPLKGMPLTELGCQFTKATDLSPIKGAKLVLLDCGHTGISDLSPLTDMKLTSLNIRETQVTDLSPLKNMPLTWLACDFEPECDEEILRSIPTLQTLNGQPAAEILRDATSDGSDMIGSWRVEHDGFTEEMQVTRPDAETWDVRDSVYKDGKEVGVWAGAQLRFMDGKLTGVQTWLRREGVGVADCTIEMWTYKGRLQFRWTAPGGSPVLFAYTRAVN